MKVVLYVFGVWVLGILCLTRVQAVPVPPLTASPLILYTDYVNQQIDRMSTIHERMSRFNREMNRYIQTFPVDEPGRIALEAKKGGLSFVNPFSAEEQAFFDASAETIQLQLQQGGQANSMQKFQQLQTIWTRLQRVCGELETYVESRAYQGSATCSEAESLLRETAVLFEDYAVVKDRLYFELDHLNGGSGQNRGLASTTPGMSGLWSLNQVISASKAVLQASRSSRLSREELTDLEVAIEGAEAQKPSHPAYSHLLARAKIMLERGNIGLKNPTVPQAFQDQGKEWFQYNIQFWPLLYEEGTGMVHYVNVYAASLSDNIPPQMVDLKWFKPVFMPIRLSGGEEQEAEPVRAPKHLIVLVDNSGSMNQPEKLGLFKAAFSKLVETMPSKDRVSVVSFSGNARLLLPATNAAEPAKAIEAVNQLICGGDSEPIEGLNLAYLEAMTAERPNESKQILMITDGGFPISGTMPARVEEKSYHQISLSIYYVGKDDSHSRRRLSKLAAIGKGEYGILKRPGQLLSWVYPQLLSADDRP